MEDDAIAHGRRHDPSDAVCRCAAILRVPDRLEPEPMRIMLTAVFCMISVTGTLEATEQLPPSESRQV